MGSGGMGYAMKLTKDDLHNYMKNPFYDRDVVIDQILKDQEIVEILNDKDFQKTLWWMLDSIRDKNPDRDLSFFKNSISRLKKLKELLNATN